MSPGTIPQTLVFNLILGLLLFGAAGTLAWPEAWIFLVIFNAGSQATGVWLRRNDPALLAERMKPAAGRNRKPRDRAAMGAVFLLVGAWIVFMGADARRFGWSHAPAWLEAVGAALVLVAFYAWIGVLRANSFASSQVRLQPERGQTVASTGPYAVVRHPMYSYTLVFLLGIPLLLGSLWGIPGAFLFAAVLAYRTIGEEAMLMDGLPGYRAYAAKVRYRLVPGIW
jgi:protein-S-isoprenylcysteine O-methyltransferase Ste14